MTPAPALSALQRAENSSISRPLQRAGGVSRRPQCSSASRKFLNSDCVDGGSALSAHLSALQRAENSSIQTPRLGFGRSPADTSVLFSEPKIPQLTAGGGVLRSGDRTSVLFSEPKIPQFASRCVRSAAAADLSALQRAENSSIFGLSPSSAGCVWPQCSSASRKFLNSRTFSGLRMH